jgi:RNA polymerase sigma-70 factor (ECF subfamily)
VAGGASDPKRDSILSFEELYRACARDVYRFALYLTRDAPLAEDLTSEAFVRAWNSDEPVRGETVKAYLITIVRRLYLRERFQRARHLPLTETIAAPEANFDHALDEKRRCASIADALGQLPQMDRTALLMRAAGEMSHKEIAASLGLSAAAVKVRIHRARRKLAQLWRQS